jgi:hypothetical protein
MHKGLIKSAFLGGLVVFLWHIVSWMGLPWHMATMQTFNNESAVAKVVMENTLHPGTYVLPSMCPADPESQVNNMEDEIGMGRARPMVFAAIQNQEMNPKAIPPYIGLLITYIVAAFLVTIVVHNLKPHNYMEKVWIITMLGLLFGIVALVPSCIWWGFGVGFTMVAMLDMIIGWFLAGLVIAKCYR